MCAFVCAWIIPLSLRLKLESSSDAWVPVTSRSNLLDTPMHRDSFRHNSLKTQRQNLNLHFWSRPGWIIRMLCLSLVLLALETWELAAVEGNSTQTPQSFATCQKNDSFINNDSSPLPHGYYRLTVRNAENRFECGTNTLLVWNQEPHMSEAGGRIIVTK